MLEAATKQHGLAVETPLRTRGRDFFPLGNLWPAGILPVPVLVGFGELAWDFPRVQIRCKSGVNQV
jgi:hypothetical protein